MFFYLNFHSYFEATGPHCFNVLSVKYFCRRNLSLRLEIGSMPSAVARKNKMIRDVTLDDVRAPRQRNINGPPEFARVLAIKPARHFVLLANSFIILSANNWNLDLKCKQQNLSGLVNYRDFREKGTWSHLRDTPTEAKARTCLYILINSTTTKHYSEAFRWIVTLYNVVYQHLNNQNLRKEPLKELKLNGHTLRFHRQSQSYTR